VPDRPRLPFAAVLFDLDGTLVDTCPDIADALNASLYEYGLPLVAEHWVRNRIGRGTRELLREALAGDSGRVTLDGLLEAFHRHYVIRCGRRGRLYPEAATTLTTLRNAGVKLGLVTNKEMRFAQLVLRVHGLDTDFDVRLFGDSLRFRKPDALVVHHCLATMRVPRKRALLIGDSEIDVRTARNGGIAVWAVSYGYNQDRPIADAEPDRVLASLSEVLEPFAPAVAALAPDYSPRASSSSLYLRSSPRN
jgi:phosphoglycolate phosphatase